MKNDHRRISIASVSGDPETTHSLSQSGVGDATAGADASRAYLVVTVEDRALSLPRVAALTAPTTTIGRGSSASSPLLLADAAISKAHFRLSRKDARWLVEDLGSKNGTYLDGQRLTGASAIGDGTILRAGRSIIVFRVGATPMLDDVDDPDLPGLAPGMVAARELVARVAALDGPVLVLGETGSGKDLAARAVHRLSGRRGSFCAANVAELRGELAASELFGRVRGAFTGATEGAGLVGTARDGTLFLDEIGDMALPVQAAILRFLEAGCYRPVGGNSEITSSARVVAATNVDLDLAVREGRFRRDLLGRLRGHSRPIELPPLRQRPEDIVAWALRLCGPSSLDAWSVAELETLLLARWPEGLRELRRTVNEGPSAALRRAPGPVGDGSSDSGAEVEVSGRTAATVITRESLQAALAATRGNVRAAAEQLGVERRRVYRALEEHGLTLSTFRGIS